MTKEQLDALEAWIEAIIEDKRIGSDGRDYLTRYECREDVELAFGLKEQAGD